MKTAFFKKTLCPVLALILLPAVFSAVKVPAAADESYGIFGDANGDGRIDALDASFIQHYDAGLLFPGGNALAAADVNGDGFIDGTDAAMILHYDAGLLPGFPVAAEILWLVNNCRKTEGVSTVVLDSQLCYLAQLKADDMEALGYFSHTSPTYGTGSEMLKAFGVKYSYMGENIAKGYKNPTAVMDGWMTSEGHRNNILKPQYKKLGVGYAALDKIWVQIFIG